MPFKHCPHAGCGGICWGYELRNAEGIIYAFEYVCPGCGALWTEYL